jgi:antirestriction protein ArdC
MAYKKNYAKTSNDKNEERDYQQELTDKFIARIEDAILCEESGLKWEKPFFNCEEWPKNALTGEKYHGGNVAALMAEEFSDPRWMTFVQMQEMSRKLDTPLHIRKGSRAAFIMKVVAAYQKDSEGNIIKSEQGKALPVLNDDGSPKIGFKWYPVFNCSSIENMPPYIKVTNEVKPLDELELLSKALQERTDLTVEHSGVSRAYYSSSKHLVHMPDPSLFKSTDAYSDTLLHEFGHSTGPALGRKMGNGFGTSEYAKEELIAELTSSFMSFRLGIPHNPSSHENHAAYLKSWLGALKDDKTLITKAANQASKATEFQMEHLTAYKMAQELRAEQAQELVQGAIANAKKSVAMSM